MFPIKLKELANKINAKIYGNENIVIYGISSIKNAKKGHITFLLNKKYKKYLPICKASAIILTDKDLQYALCSSLVVKNPYITYIYIAKIIHNVVLPSKNISKNSVISKNNVKIGKNVCIGANTVIESNVKIEDNVYIGSNCFIGKNSKIGLGTKIWSNVSIYDSVIIGNKCTVNSGSVIGSDGFGYINNKKGKWIKIPHLGKVIIGNKVKIGACTTVDRGSLDNTIINNGVIIDNHCQIAHNVYIGKNTAVAAGVIIAGSVKIGNYCMLGGATVINGHIEICDNVLITGMSMVIRTINKPGTYSSGIPIQPNKTWRKTTVLVMQIDKLRKNVKKLQEKLFKKLKY